jgi:hypothetical protein
MKNIKYLLVALVVIILISPNFSSAMTVQELLAKIQELQQQLAQLQAQLAQMPATSTVQWCHNFNVNLKTANRGEEVSALQAVLEKEGLQLRAVECPKCKDKIVHPADLNCQNRFNDLKGKTFNVKLRMVGNSHAVSIPKEIVDLTNKYNISILFSTKSDSTYDVDIRQDLHSFQLSITNLENRKDIEPNVPDIERRYKFFRSLKDRGFKVGIRIQPFIPGVSSSWIIDKFKDADYFSIEGLKLIPNNQEQIDYFVDLLKILF